MQTNSIQTREIDSFKRKLRESLTKETLPCRTVKLAKHTNVYLSGDKSDLVYFIETGEIKLLMLSPEGKECLLSIHSFGDIFGELGIGRLGERLESAMAMTDTQLKVIPSTKFLEHLSKEALLVGFVKYLAARVEEQQQVIANLVTVDSEQRLGKTLLQLAKTIGKKYSYGTVIELKISHEELSEMIGTTRPRTSMFMQNFRNFGLITLTKERHIIVNEQKLLYYLAQLRAQPKCE